MTKEPLNIRWSELKSQIRQHWNKLTEDELSGLGSGVDELTSLLRKRYGYGKAQAEIEISKWLHESKLRFNKPKY
jgi:hypothetical protein